MYKNFTTQIKYKTNHLNNTLSISILKTFGSFKSTRQKKYKKIRVCPNRTSAKKKINRKTFKIIFKKIKLNLKKFIKIKYTLE